jgi:hypothetical protein
MSAKSVGASGSSALRDIQGSVSSRMRMFVAFPIVPSAAYYWNAEYIYGKLYSGVRSIGRSISHNMGH